MYCRAIRNDLMNSKVISLTTMLFVAAAALLVSLAAVLAVHLSGSIEAMMIRAKTPHFMQMHSGGLDAQRLAAFAQGHEAVEDVQAVEFLNVEGARIIFEGGSLAASVQDNGFSVQNGRFDFLIGLDGERIEVSPGEVYVPLTYMRKGLTAAGETMRVSGREFTVAGFLRDSQMNSLLSSSKRFLVSREDFEGLRELGTVEYLIEFRLREGADPGAFEADYVSAGLEANGPAITYPLFRMLNGLSDGLMIAVILLVSALVTAVAFLCIRFTLLAKIEEDYREIGVMKAVGLRSGDIKKIYLVTYAAVAGAGCLLGYGLSFFFRDALLADIRLFMGESENAALAQPLAAAGVLLVYLVILAYVNGVLGRFRKIAPAEAVRFGISQEKGARNSRFSLRPGSLVDTNLFLGVKDVFARKKLYATMFAVLVLAAFIIIVPRNLYNTIASETFITYMGAGNSDLRFDIQQTGGMEEKAAEIAAALEQDDEVARFAVLATRSFRTAGEEGAEQRLKVELGDHAAFPLACSRGRMPVAENEIALSAMNAEELGKKVGDALTLVTGGGEKRLTVTGIYSDVTNGGRTAKALFSDPAAQTMWYVLHAGLSDTSLTGTKVAEYAEKFGYAKVSDIDEFIRQTYGPTIDSIGKASRAALAAALGITLLITLLFMKMLIARDRFSIAVMKSVGFTGSDIRKQYSARAALVLAAGLIIGTLLANTLGEALAGALIASFGASSFAFTVDPLEAYLLPPLLMGLCVLAAVRLGTGDAARIKISEHIKE